MRQNDNIQQDGPKQYRTGPTVPPKSHGGIAFLLILVIFLCGIISILSMMNIQLFQMLRNQQDVSLQLRSNNYGVAPAQELPEAAQAQPVYHENLGIYVQPITAFYQEYYQIPQGLFIDQVDENSHCYAQGIRSGDILESVNSIPMKDVEDLNRILNQAAPGENLEFIVYRNEGRHQITILIQGE